MPRLLTTFRPVVALWERHPFLRDVVIGGAVILPALFLTALVMAAVG